ncbi:MAG: Flp family type IVb pilin [Pseudomonadota bacterium]
MQELIRTWREVWTCRRAATSIEYGLIAALMTIALIASISTVGSPAGNNFNTVMNMWPE